ncbi:MAG: NifU family protein [Campylobacterota bacterium]|nr:NifU family protein [Campylobacterota bacterium]
MIPFTDEELYHAVENNLPKVSAYVDSHGGGLALLGVKDNTIYIQLGGVCGGCSMSMMTTNMVIRKELRTLIHPELFVVNVDGTDENRLPDNYYAPTKDIVDEPQEEGVVAKIKNIFS